MLVQLPPDRFLDQLEGRVVDFYGEPMEGAQVMLSAVRSIGSNGHSSMTGEPHVTDQKGRFRIENAPWRGLGLVILTPTSIGGGAQNVALADYDLTAQFDITLDPECRGRIDASSAEGADRIQFVDAEGGIVPVTELTALARVTRHSLYRSGNGQFPNFTLRQRATTAVLMQGDQELRRTPIRLSADRWNELSL